jgi:hypothetical protein
MVVLKQGITKVYEGNLYDRDLGLNESITMVISEQGIPNIYEGDLYDTVLGLK